MPNTLRQPEWLAVALAIVCVAAAGCAVSTDKTTTPTTTPTVLTAHAPATTTSTAREPRRSGEDEGAYVFRAECAACHGAHGEGNLGPSLVGIAATMTEAAQLSLIRHGFGRMPPFGNALTKDEIAKVIAYTRTQLPSSRGGG